MSDSKKNISKKFGFFDVDSRELKEDGHGLQPRERMLPFSGHLDEIYDLVYQHKLKLVFSTCCSGRFLKSDSLEYVLHIPMESEDNDWRKNIGDYDYYYLEKRSFGKPRLNYENCAYDLFRHNKNAMELFKALDVEKWVIFGNAFDVCVRKACLSLLREGFKIAILSDVLAPSAKPQSIVSKEQILNELEEGGAEIIEYKSLIKKYSLITS